MQKDRRRRRRRRAKRRTACWRQSICEYYENKIRECSFLSYSMTFLFIWITNQQYGGIQGGYLTWIISCSHCFNGQFYCNLFKRKLLGSGFFLCQPSGGGGWFNFFFGWGGIMMWFQGFSFFFVFLRRRILISICVKYWKVNHKNWALSISKSVKIV